MINGKTGEMELNTRRAADGRHPPFITTFALPATHPALPEGTILKEGTEAGTADVAAASGTQVLLGVLDTRVEANEGAGNVLVHGSCPSDILVTVAAGTATPAPAALIKALRGIGIYV